MTTIIKKQSLQRWTGPESKITSLSSLGVVLVLYVTLMLPTSQALALEISYSGRLSEESGTSIAGPQDFTVRFYNTQQNGDVVGPTLKLANTELRDGVFQLSLNLDNSQLTAIFGDGTKAAYVEVEAGGKVYPRQQIIAVPLALRVPVDTNYLNYADGKLKIESVDLNQVNGLSAALAAKADATTVSSTSVATKNLSDLTNAPAARTNLGLGSLATASTISNAEISTTAAISDTKLATISTAGKVLGSAITSGTIGGTTAFQSSGDITTSGIMSAGTVTTAQQNGVLINPFNTASGNTGELRFSELISGGTNYVGFKAPDILAANKIWTLPAADGTNGQILKTDGSGNLDWINVGGTGTVTSVNLTAPAAGIAVSGGPVTGSGSITLALGDDLAAVEAIATTGGVERTGANTWSTYTLSAAGKALIDDPDATAQRATIGLGSLATLSAVGSTEISNDSIMDADINSTAAIAQSKISGLTTSLSGKEPTITAGTTAHYYRGDKSWQTFDSAARGAVSIVAPLTYNSGTGVFGLGQASGVADGYLSSSDFTAFNSKQTAITAATTLNTGTVTTALQNAVQLKPFNALTGNTGELRFDELAASGSNYVGFKAPDTLATDRIWTLPAADGTAGQLLKTDGSGTLGWVTGAAGSVTSINLTAPAAGITVSGGPVTGSGSITLALGDDLAAVEAIATTGGVERTGANTWSTYTLSAAGKALIDDPDATAQRATIGLGSLATLSTVGSTEISNDSIMDADINTSAAIATSKLSGAVTSIASHGLGSLATLSAVGSPEITNDTIVNADINASAAIADTKLASITTAGKVSGSAITSGTIAGTTIFSGSGGIDTTGMVTSTGHFVVKASGGSSTHLRFNDGDSSNYVGLKAPATVSADIVWTLPAADGTSGHVLTTNGTGTLSWANRSYGTGGGAAPTPSSGCPTGYILVPGDLDYGTTDFCVMKYEAKFGIKGAISQALGLPARGIFSQDSARASCRNLGPGYALINNAEWMTLATNIAAVGTNWSGGSVGSGALNRGHSDYSPSTALAADADDNNACVGTEQTCSSTVWNNQRRTHVLSNGNVVWDLAGNVHDWVDYANYEDKPTPANAAWNEYTAVTGSTSMPITDLVPTNAVKSWWDNTWNTSAKGIGQYYGGNQASGGGVIRGSNSYDGTSAGIFAINMSPSPSLTHLLIGFRCVFRLPSN